MCFLENTNPRVETQHNTILQQDTAPTDAAPTTATALHSHSQGGVVQHSRSNGTGHEPHRARLAEMAARQPTRRRRSRSMLVRLRDAGSQRAFTHVGFLLPRL